MNFLSQIALIGCFLLSFSINLVGASENGSLSLVESYNLVLENLKDLTFNVDELLIEYKVDAYKLCDYALSTATLTATNREDRQYSTESAGVLVCDFVSTHSTQMEGDVLAKAKHAVDMELLHYLKYVLGERHIMATFLYAVVHNRLSVCESMIFDPYSYNDYKIEMIHNFPVIGRPLKDVSFLLNALNQESILARKIINKWNIEADSMKDLSQDEKDILFRLISGRGLLRTTTRPNYMLELFARNGYIYEALFDLDRFVEKPILFKEAIIVEIIKCGELCLDTILDKALTLKSPKLIDLLNHDMIKESGAFQIDENQMIRLLRGFRDVMDERIDLIVKIDTVDERFKIAVANMRAFWETQYEKPDLTELAKYYVVYAMEDKNFSLAVYIANIFQVTLQRFQTIKLFINQVDLDLPKSVKYDGSVLKAIKYFMRQLRISSTDESYKSFFPTAEEWLQIINSPKLKSESREVLDDVLYYQGYIELVSREYLRNSLWKPTLHRRK
ncbi:hypothetical protein O9G_002656 [Rozella allomycis CSF55]|uniref:Uncharacterized protein n=1 Tax=Rozella allomycis (strain CSF55) TaxID=988480 RepID=A0A075B3X0_ROZAC|nr:hypothetical protein O9G_002656 [Rozella allomycis CSF55]|eukprot:EPZ35648.1 hypothetical protein O9G_002656 [Rozella allomycis CSF55]